MNHFHITFQNGKQFEFQAHNNDQALLRAESWIKRWNQVTARIERVNIMNPGQKIYVGFVENEDYDNTQPSLLHDPEYLYKRDEPKKRKRRAAKASKEGTTTVARRTNFEVPLADLADQLGVAATVIRRKLRSSNVEKPEGGWGWSSSDHETVILIKSWFTEGK